MRGVGFYKHGGPEVLQAIEVEDPKLDADNDVLVRVSATSLNRIDTISRMGAPTMKLPLPHLPGSDIIGKVEAIGTNVSGISPGEVVIANPVYGCNACKKCRSGNEVECSSWKTIGLNTWGSYGELVRLPSRVLMRPPSGFSEEELSTFPIDLSASWRSIKVLAKARRGETIVIKGASGNLGILSIKIAKALKLKVIALSRGISKREGLKRVGADHIIDALMAPEEIQKEILDYTNGFGADIAIDPFGPTLNDSISIVRHGGRVIAVGTMLGLQSNVDVRSLYRKSVRVIGVHNSNLNDLKDALDFVSKSNIKPVIYKTMPISEAAEAHRQLEAALPFGKIVFKHQW